MSEAELGPAADIVAEVVAAVAAGDPAGVRLLLHPYLHWTEQGRTVRGRTKVLHLLSGRSHLDVPAGVELRDEQIYRWIADD